MEQSRAGHGACRASSWFRQGMAPESTRWAAGRARGAKPEGDDAPSGRRAIQMISRSPLPHVPPAPRDTPAVSAPSLDSLCFGNMKKGLSLWDTCSSFVSFLGVFFFLSTQIISHKPSTFPLPCRLLAAVGWREAEGKGGDFGQKKQK